MLPLTSTLTPIFTFIIILEMIEGKRKKYSSKRLALYGREIEHHNTKGNVVEI
jgi:hypothetical protein